MCSKIAFVVELDKDLVERFARIAKLKRYKVESITNIDIKAWEDALTLFIDNYIDSMLNKIESEKIEVC